MVHSGLPMIIRPPSDCGPFCIHRRSASCILCVFVICVFNVPWATFDAQAQYLVHVGLPTIIRPPSYWGHFVCTGAALRAFCVFLLTVYPGLFLMHRRSAWCMLGCQRWSNPLPIAGDFVCTGAALRAFCVFLLTVSLTCPGLFLLHRRSTWCMLGGQ